MKIKHVSLALVAVTLATAGLVGCSKNDEPSADATIASVKFDGFKTSYRVGETIEWDKVSASVTYSDQAVVKYTTADAEFDVATASSESTKFIIRTDGLYAKTKDGQALTEADKTTTNPYVVTIALAKTPTVTVKVADVYVGKITNDRFAVISYSLQTNLEKYEDKRAEVKEERSGSEAEAQFKSDRDIFTVGTLNEFRFDPDITFIDKSKLTEAQIDDLIAHPEKIDEYAITGHDMAVDKIWSLKEVNDLTEEVQPAAAADYEIVDNNAIQFSESAAGKHFRVSVALEDFPADLFQTEIDPVEFDFKVQKGLNIYSAKELGALNLTHFTKEELDAKHFDAHFGNNPRDDVDQVFARHENEVWSYYRLNYVDCWTKFLNKENGGPFTSAELVKYQDVPAVFFMDSFDLKKSDVPAEYFVYEGEPGAAASNVDCFRDGAELYVPIVWGEPGETGVKHNVEINGNYFNLNVDENEIPLCKNIRGGGKLNFYGDDTAVVEAGHATLFKFCGINPGSEDDKYFDDQVDTAYGAKGIIRNLNSVGNTGEAKYGSRFVLTGLIFVKNHYCSGLYENNIIKQYQIAYFADHMVGQGNGSTIDQFDNTFIKDSKAYDIMNCGIFNYRNGGLAVSGSSFDRFGGAPLINAGSSDTPLQSANTSFTPDCVFNNEITGQEVYFKAVGAEDQVTKITALDELIGAYAKQDENFEKTISFMKNDKMNLVSMNMDGDWYLDAGNAAFHASVTINKGAANEVNASMEPMYAGDEHIIECADNALKQAIAFATDVDSNLFYTTVNTADTEHYGRFNKKTGEWPSKSLEAMPNFDYVVAQLMAGYSMSEEQARAYALAHRGEGAINWHEIAGDYIKMYIPIECSGKHGDKGFTTLGLVFRLYH